MGKTIGLQRAESSQFHKRYNQRGSGPSKVGEPCSFTLFYKSKDRLMDEEDSIVEGRNTSAGGNINQTIEAEELSSAQLGKLRARFA